MKFTFLPIICLALTANAQEYQPDTATAEAMSMFPGIIDSSYAIYDRIKDVADNDSKWRERLFWLSEIDHTQTALLNYQFWYAAKYLNCSTEDSRISGDSLIIVALNFNGVKLAETVRRLKRVSIDSSIPRDALVQLHDYGQFLELFLTIVGVDSP